MKRSFTLGSMLALAAIGMLTLSACASPALAQTTGPATIVASAPATILPPTPAAPTDQPHTISVTGSGTVLGTPDIATAQIGVQTRDADATKAVAANTTKMTAIIAALKAQGIAEKDIQTTNFSVSAQQDVDANGQPKGTMTFIVDNTVDITVRDLTKVGVVLSASVDAGANNIYGVSYSVADHSALEAQARDAAMADAKARATQLAKDAGTVLDAPISISESISNGPTPYFARDAVPGVASAASAPVPVQSGQISVQIQVNVTYQMH
jgi:uncharacterized protein YggE